MDKKFILMIIMVCITSLLNCSCGFGFDSASSSSSCNQKHSRRGRVQLIKSIPCNLGKQSYCNLPGSSYPWHAVRRFVHENQGLMKRMYGDVHQISVLRHEIQNNEIGIEELHFKQQSHLASGRGRRGQQNSARYLHSEYQNSRTNDVLTEPHFRPAASPSTTTTTVRPTTMTAPDSSTASPQQAAEPIPGDSTMATLKTDHKNLDDISMDDDDDDDDDDDAPDNNLESNSVYEVTTQHSINDNKVVKAPPIHHPKLNKSESATIPTTLRIIQHNTGSASAEKQQKADIQIPQTELMQKIQENIQNVNESLGKKHSQLDRTSSADPQFFNQSSTTEPAERSTENAGGSGSGGVAGDKKKSGANMMEGQLFQDTVHKDLPTTTFRGVNACPVKEEVVAPFWANNTRGEVLALLNLYPFEQYVHWERCTNEHKQMYCRDGCRCEQQYSLHRLLAYDPRDECRGIFSDWFRFPSCCVCKCYNMPLEFRATSRSPRSESEMDGGAGVGRHPIDLAEAEVHRAIYEHATEDWYRPKDEFDLNYEYLD